MTSVTTSDIETVIDRFLLPTAPSDLVDAVRERLRNGRLEIAGLVPRVSEPCSNGGLGGPTPVRDPWHLLHVARGAPQEIVDIAYDLWRTDREPNVLAPAPHVATSSAPYPALQASMPAQQVPPPPREVRVAERPAEAVESLSGTARTRAFVETAEGQRFGITEHPLRIGAGTDCDVVLPQDGPLEARIWTHGDRYLLRAVAGRVRAGGERVMLVVLDDGDILEIGHATFRFQLNQHH